jgi:hypothetical protein
MTLQEQVEHLERIRTGYARSNTNLQIERDALQEQVKVLESALRECLEVVESLDISREDGDKEMPIIARARAALESK